MDDVHGKIGLGFQGSKPIAEYSKLAQIAEEYNFGWMHIYDDLVHRATWPILFSMAPATKNMAIGPAVTHSFFRHPVVTANNIACLDEVTNGRAILGLGKGSYYDCFGLPSPEHYVTRLRETVEMVSRLLRNDMQPWKGKYFSKTQVGVFRFRPVRKSVPIFLGTWGKKTGQLAGEMKEITAIKVDNCWNPGYVKVMREYIDQGAKKSGRDPNEVSIEAGVLTYLSKDVEEAKARLKWVLAADYLPGYGDMLDFNNVSKEESDAVTMLAKQGRFDEGAKLISDSTLESFTAFGSLDKIIEHTDKMLKVGAARVCFNHPHGPDAKEAVRELGAKVLPHFQ